VAFHGRAAGLRMYGTASAPGSARALAEEGVVFIDHRRQDVAGVVREHEPAGVDAVLDHIGGANIGQGHGLLVPGGVLVSYAFSGRPGRMAADTVRGAVRVALLGLRPGRRTALCMVPREIRSDNARYRRHLARVLDLLHRGELRVRVGGTRPLREAAGAHGAMEAGTHGGKLVLTTD
jgi:NADPH:quinone reductase